MEPIEEVNDFGYTKAEHEMIIKRVNAGHIPDYDGSRRKYADQVSTSQALVRRARSRANGR